MPTLSFVLTTPLSLEETWIYLRTYSNVREWDQITQTVEQTDENTWKSSLARWPAVRMTYERIETSDEDSRTVSFEGVSDRGDVKTLERFKLQDDTAGGTSITYTMQLGMSGWKRIPCVGAAVWVHLRSESSRAYDRLKSNLEALHRNVV